MEISGREAQESLRAIDQVSAQMRRTMASGAPPYHLILWGGVWFVGYMASQFLTAFNPGIVWLVLVVLASGVSAILGYRFRTKVRTRAGFRFGIFWLFLWLYSIVWWWISQPRDPNQASLLVVTYAMFGYVVIGLWSDRKLLWTGVGATILALIGYYLLPDFFSLWMAVLGGGTLIGSGLYILKAWAPANTRLEG